MLRLFVALHPMLKYPLTRSIFLENFLYHRGLVFLFLHTSFQPLYTMFKLYNIQTLEYFTLLVDNIGPILMVLYTWLVDTIGPTL